MIEESYSHKEEVPFDNLTIEHVMPQKLSDWWKAQIGDDWEATQELFVHTIGNLTLTAYNSELSNADFYSKKAIYNDSHLEINKYFDSISTWTRTEIEKRSDILAKKALEIWSYFGKSSIAETEDREVTGTTPISLKILGQKFRIQSWRDVLEQTLNTIADLEPEKFNIIANNYPRYISVDKSKFRATRQLQNGYYIEVNLSAQTIRNLCYQAMESIELTTEEWEVITI
jgi:hypothetical protein